MSLINMIKFNVLGDDRGHLIALEQHKNVPFEIKRVYYIYGLEQERPRGFHAHKALRQLAICISGSCDILIDDGREKEVVTLDRPMQGLLIEPMQWHVMSNFSSDCIFMVLASEHYDESDYIRDYEEFLRAL
ncbi:FdtA/QdtA family cupin domain-containing protein [Mixta calida]|uniref:FdtA/QdtA family cupin domain-containing protein n=1 Tax=Mixta calida TaxID=665913 RepID=UPI0034D7758F